MRSGLVVLAVLTAALAAPPLPLAAVTGVSPPSTAVHLVKPGDTLSAIAGRYGVTIASLVTANRLASPSARLRIGQRLVIPAAAVARIRRALPALTGRRPPAPPRALILAVPDFAELLPPFRWPVDGQVSSTFGRRRMGWHRGIDITADLGTPVAAAAPGAVVSSAYETRYGRVVKVLHGNGFLTVYAHNDQNLVEVGERVTLGQIIAAVGRTGRATSPHVHFEIRHAGFAYNPLYMLPLPPRVMEIIEGLGSPPERGSPRTATITESDEDEPDDADE
jgi:murein DD-endopeptidase MepM/ murein hydrolase activator NlpD